jgi:hypothetical protein
MTGKLILAFLSKMLIVILIFKNLCLELCTEKKTSQIFVSIFQFSLRSLGSESTTRPTVHELKYLHIKYWSVTKQR